MTYSLTFTTKSNNHCIKEDMVFCDNFIRPFAYNPHNVKLWIFGNEYGAICAIWASCEQNALDAMLDNGLEHFLVSASDYETMSEEEKESLCYLGNASEPCDLTYAWCESWVCDLNNKNDFDIIAKFIIAEDRSEDTLDFNE